VSTFTAIAYHIVFSTKNRVPVLERDGRPDLFRYIWGIVKNRRGHLYRIYRKLLMEAGVRFDERYML
jgi:putative transposase